MKAIIGLGNPENNYSWTRHNIGKEIINSFSKQFLSEYDWKFSQKLNSSILKKDEVILIKPETFMNESGIPIQKTLNYFNISPSETIIIYDELDLVIGKYKLGFDKGSKIHKGVISIKQNLHEPFFHLRIGIRDESILGSVQKSGSNPANYVLTKFSEEDITKLKKMIENSINKELTGWLSK